MTILWIMVQRKPSKSYGIAAYTACPPLPCLASLLSISFLSKGSLKLDVFNDWISFLDSLFQGFTTRCEKTFLLWSFRDHFLKIFLPLNISGYPLSFLIWKNVSGLVSTFSVSILKVSIISPLNLLSTSLVNPRYLSLWSYDLFLNPCRLAPVSNH